MSSREFNYAIGRYWKGKSGAISTYAFGTEVHYGDKTDAENMRKFIEERTGKKYKIFELVERK